VVVFESEPIVGGRLGSYEHSSIPFTAGASYFSAQGPHMQKFLKQLLEESAISEWKPRVGIVGKSAVTSGEYVGFIPAINTQEQEINIEAWIENWPKTGAPPPGGKARPASTFWEPTKNVPIYDLEAPTPIHRKSHAQGFGQGHGSGSWYICKPDMASLVKHLLKGIDVRCNSRVQAALPQLGQVFAARQDQNVS
jgi:predicted NAD/FAD-dependent oxidoreductase